MNYEPCLLKSKEEETRDGLDLYSKKKLEKPPSPEEGPWEGFNMP